MSPLVFKLHLCSEGGRDPGSVQASLVSLREPGIHRTRPRGRWGFLLRSDELHGKRVSTRLCGVHTSVHGRQWGVRLQIRDDRAGPTPHRGASVCRPRAVSSKTGRVVSPGPGAGHDCDLELKDSRKACALG